MDGGDGRSSPLSLASLPPYFGGLGKRPGCGGKRASIGAFGFASLLWGGWIITDSGGGRGRRVYGIFRGHSSSSHLFLQEHRITAVVYIRIAKGLEGTEDMDAATGCATIKGVKEAYERMGWLRDPLSEDESKTATELVKGSSTAFQKLGYCETLVRPYAGTRLQS
jgi:hypothetical protein